MRVAPHTHTHYTLLIEVKIVLVAIYVYINILFGPYNLYMVRIILSYFSLRAAHLNIEAQILISKMEFIQINIQLSNTRIAYNLCNFFVCVCVPVGRLPYFIFAHTNTLKMVRRFFFFL